MIDNEPMFAPLETVAMTGFHEGHNTGVVYANMISYHECDDCEVITLVWNLEDKVLWSEGDEHDLLIHYVGHDYIRCND